MRELDLHKHSFNAVKRGDGSLDPLRSKCECGVYSEYNPHINKSRIVSKEYVEKIMSFY